MLVHFLLRVHEHELIFIHGEQIITAGGKYSYLQTEFILAQSVAISQATTVVTCWCVGCNGSVIEMLSTRST